MSTLDFTTVFASGMWIGIAGGLGADTAEARVIRFIVISVVILPLWGVQAYQSFKRAKRTP